MSTPVIKVENLSKLYRLGEVGTGSLAHDVNRWWYQVRGKEDPYSQVGQVNDQSQRAESDWVYALKDINFEVQQGEILGIIGRNGAGKSTLLKILSRVTAQTSGNVKIKGRIASLLEVGTGFHPELSGRDNIFLNGAILGMSRAEIKRKFDEIVAFSEIEKFIDTPVKRYSSGMYVRLAFAVAANLEPDILIVDEVLAVGDAQFQRKCLGKMGEVSKGGRTILFVSHNMSAVAQLCNAGLLLQKGHLIKQAPINEIVSAYLTSCTDAAKGAGLTGNNEELRRRKRLFFHSAAIRTSAGIGSVDLDVREPFDIELGFEAPNVISRVDLSIQIMNTDGRPVFTSLQSECDPSALDSRRQGRYNSRITIPGYLLMPGNYVVHIAAHEPAGELFDRHESVVTFTVHDTGTAFAIYNNYAGIGTILQRIPWKVESEPPAA